jgi:hypothetical protein
MEITKSPGEHAGLVSLSSNSISAPLRYLFSPSLATSHPPLPPQKNVIPSAARNLLFPPTHYSLLTTHCLSLASSPASSLAGARFIVPSSPRISVNSAPLRYLFSSSLATNHSSLATSPTENSVIPSAARNLLFSTTHYSLLTPHCSSPSSNPPTTPQTPGEGPAQSGTDFSLSSSLSKDA